MRDQHEKIKGRRDLSQEEIDLMNEGKELAEQCGAFIAKLDAIDELKQQLAAKEAELVGVREALGLLYEHARLYMEIAGNVDGIVKEALRRGE